MSKLRSYFLPTSITWWGGVGLIALGVAQAFGYGNSLAVSTGSDVLATLLGGATGSPPAVNILLGMSIVGWRAKQERDS